MNGLELGVAIPAYRNATRLRRCLASIAQLDQTLLARTTVVDDSGDGSVATVLQSEFPTVMWIEHERNQGFAAAANRAVSECQEALVLLLNDDAELRSDPRQTAVECFRDESVFAVSLRSTDNAGNLREGAKRLVWRFGIAKVLHGPRDQLPLINGVSRSSYAVGGHAVYRKSAFIGLGGFDHKFHPYYWEDVDLSMRAAIAGMITLYCDRCNVVHHEDGAIRLSSQRDATRCATWRNRLLFSLRHASGAQKALQPLGIAWYQVNSKLRRDRALSSALRELPELRKLK